MFHHLGIVFAVVSVMRLLFGSDVAGKWLGGHAWASPVVAIGVVVVLVLLGRALFSRRSVRRG